jgi:ankyrin repeat protein
MIKLLIDHQPNIVNSYQPIVQNAFVQNALYIAVCWGRSDIANLLIDKGADLNFRNTEGHSVLVSAILVSNSQLVKKLIDTGKITD